MLVDCKLIEKLKEKYEKKFDRCGTCTVLSNLNSNLFIAIKL